MVVPVVRVGIVPVVLFSVVIVPAVVLIVPVSSAFITLATVILFRLFESEASPIKNVSFVAITVSVVRSWINPEVGVALLTRTPSLAAVTSFATPSEKDVPAVNEAIVFSPIR